MVRGDTTDEAQKGRSFRKKVPKQFHDYSEGSEGSECGEDGDVPEDTTAVASSQSHPLQKSLISSQKKKSRKFSHYYYFI